MKNIDECDIMVITLLYGKFACLRNYSLLTEWRKDLYSSQLAKMKKSIPDMSLPWNL